MDRLAVDGQTCLGPSFVSRNCRKPDNKKLKTTRHFYFYFRTCTSHLNFAMKLLVLMSCEHAAQCVECNQNVVVCFSAPPVAVIVTIFGSNQAAVFLHNETTGKVFFRDCSIHLISASTASLTKPKQRDSQVIKSQTLCATALRSKACRKGLAMNPVPKRNWRSQSQQQKTELKQNAC